jgi:small subunit ribosomal protein S21
VASIPQAESRVPEKRGLCGPPWIFPREFQKRKIFSERDLDLRTDRLGFGQERPKKMLLTVGHAAGSFLIFSTDNSRQFTMPIEIKMRKNEPIDRALRRMKKKLDRENIIKDVRAKRYYEKPCERRRRKDKVAAFTAMLRARYAN